MRDLTELKTELKGRMVEDLMLQVGIDDMKDDLPLFGPEGLGLDSVDALQLVVMLDKHYGLKVPDPEAAKAILQSVETMAQAVAEHRRNSD